MENNQKGLIMAEYVKNKLGLEILTDSGWQKFDGIVNKGRKKTITVRLEKDSLRVTPEHQIYVDGYKKISANKLKEGELVITVTGLQRVLSVTKNIIEDVYDIINAGPDKRFYADDILCSNCEFLIADETLINPSTLIELSGIEPINRMGQVRWYDEPKKGMIYAVALDPSLGTGSDPAAIQIFEANTTKQIGEWKHNKTDIPSQIKLLAQINKYIADITNEPNNIYYSVENNSIGEAALVSLNEYGEANIPGVFISEPGKKRKGFNTTNKTKLAACAKFKTLIESKRMHINSRSLISELKAFIAHGGSYAAKVGDTDDLVMSSLLIVRILQQLGDYHYDLENQIRDHDEVIQPLPFFAVIS
jgi:hypothetical protein